MISKQTLFSAGTSVSLVFILVIAFSSGRASVPVKFRSFTKEESGFGTTLTVALDSAPFPHGDRSRGMQLDDAYYPLRPHYSSSQVRIFIPRGFLPMKYVDLVFFFHGWYSSVEDADAAFELTRQFAESGINALLILPETVRYAPDSFAGKLEEAGGFKRLVSDLLAGLASRGQLGRAYPGRIILAGHSGGYRAVARILELGDLKTHVEEVYLFDALFGGLEKFVDWIVTGHGRFVSVHSIGGDTMRNAENFVGSLRDLNVPVVVFSDLRDKRGKKAGVLIGEAGELSKSREAALRSRITFMRSEGGHFDVVSKRNQFRLLLSSSGLGNPPMR